MVSSKPGVLKLRPMGRIQSSRVLNPAHPAIARRLQREQAVGGGCAIVLAQATPRGNAVLPRSWELRGAGLSRKGLHAGRRWRSPSPFPSQETLQAATIAIAISISPLKGEGAGGGDACMASRVGRPQNLGSGGAEGGGRLCALAGRGQRKAESLLPLAARLPTFYFLFSVWLPSPISLLLLFFPPICLPLYTWHSEFFSLHFVLYFSLSPVY